MALVSVATDRDGTLPCRERYVACGGMVFRGPTERLEQGAVAIGSPSEWRDLKQYPGAGGVASQEEKAVEPRLRDYQRAS